jgi:plasmid segregation protein ParM
VRRRRTPRGLTEFEVLGKHSKTDQELSKVLVVGVFAAKALRDYVR